MLVLDSSILIASALPQEPMQTQAKAAMLEWVDSKAHFAAPVLFRAELASVLRKAVYQRRMEAEYGRMLLLKLMKTPIDFVDDDALLISAYDIATRLNLPRAYDSQYLALAERLDCDFWTADETLYHSIHSRFAHIRWLGQLNAPSG